MAVAEAAKTIRDVKWALLTELEMNSKVQRSCSIAPPLRFTLTLNKSHRKLFCSISHYRRNDDKTRCNTEG